MIESILSDLEKYLNIPFDKSQDNELQGYYFINMPKFNKIWVKDLNPGIFIKSIITTMISTQNPENFFMHLMKANFLGQGTGGSIISLDPEEKLLTLSLRMNYEVNYKIFRDKLEDFLNYIEYWKKEIDNYEARQVCYK